MPKLQIEKKIFVMKDKDGSNYNYDEYEYDTEESIEKLKLLVNNFVIKGNYEAYLVFNGKTVYLNRNHKIFDFSNYISNRGTKHLEKIFYDLEVPWYETIRDEATKELLCKKIFNLYTINLETLSCNSNSDDVTIIDDSIWFQAESEGKIQKYFDTMVDRNNKFYLFCSSASNLYSFLLTKEHLRRILFHPVFGGNVAIFSIDLDSYLVFDHSGPICLKGIWAKIYIDYFQNLNVLKDKIKYK